MKKILAALSFAVVLAVAVTGCEPAMKITAGTDTPKVDCLEVIHIVGKVTPASATPKVTLQQTKTGKWVDLKGWPDTDTSGPATARTANVSKSTGGYSIPLLLIYMSNQSHLRVRSTGGATSHGFYLKSEGIQDGC